jgi:hypothetical protein
VGSKGSPGQGLRPTATLAVNSTMHSKNKAATYRAPCWL